MSRRVLVTGADTFWGGRMIQALETDPEHGRDPGHGHPAPVGALRAGRVRPGGPDLLHPEPDREGDPGRHDPAHVHDHELDHGAEAGHARDQRDRDDEPPGGGRSRRLVGAPHRGEVVDARLRLRGQRPEHVPRGHAPDEPGARTAWSARWSRPRGWSGTSPRTTRRRGSPSSGSPTSSGTHLTTPISRNLSRPLCPAIFGFDPLLQFVEEDDVVRALLHVTRGGIPGLYNVAGDGRLPWSEVASICGTRLVPLSPYSPLEDPPPGAAVRPARGARGPPALRARRRHAALRRHRLHLQRHQRRRGADLHQGAAAAPAVGPARRIVVHLRARRRAVLPPLAVGDWAPTTADGSAPSHSATSSARGPPIPRP